MLVFLDEVLILEEDDQSTSLFKRMKRNFFTPYLGLKTLISVQCIHSVAKCLVKVSN